MRGTMSEKAARISEQLRQLRQDYRLHVCLEAADELDRLAAIAEEHRRQRDLLLEAAEYAEHVVSVAASLQEGTEAARITRDRLRAAIAECGREEGDSDTVRPSLLGETSIPCPVLEMSKGERR